MFYSYHNTGPLGYTMLCRGQKLNVCTFSVISLFRRRFKFVFSVPVYAQSFRFQVLQRNEDSIMEDAG